MLSKSFVVIVFTSFTFLASCVAAGPAIAVPDNFVTLPLSLRLNLNGTGTGHRLVQHDQARARQLVSTALAKRNGKRAHPVPLTNGLVNYIVEATTGRGSRPFSLIVDTGSSNTWVGAQGDYSLSDVPDKDKEGDVSVEYGSGEFSGVEVYDSIKVGRLTLNKQSIGVAQSSKGFDGVDGILGIGPKGLTEGTVDGRTTIPTIVDTAYDNDQIDSKRVGISFEPTTNEGENGQLVIGGNDASKYIGHFTTVPITSAEPSSAYVGIDQKVTYGSKDLLNSAGITDTGTTLTLLASGAYKKYKDATGAIEDDSTGLLQVTQAQYNKMKSLVFNIGGTDFEFTKNAQIWPRSLNVDIGGDPDSIYLIVAPLGSPEDGGLDFINGMTWLQRFYTVYDSKEQTLAIARTPFTDADTN